MEVILSVLPEKLNMKINNPVNSFQDYGKITIIYKLKSRK